MKQTLAYKATRRFALRAIAAAVKRGANPAWFNYRAIHTESLDEYCRRRAADRRVDCRRLHERKTATNPLPCNIADRDALPRDRGWWGYSFHDVPARESGRSLLATLPDARVVPSIDDRGQFWVTLLTDDGTSPAIREMALRPRHVEVLRTAATDSIAEAVWLLERVFENYAHWFTAHMPKLLVLRELGLADRILLPQRRPQFIDDALVHFGFDPARFRTFDKTRILRVEKLTVMDTDRFRPELLRRVRDECPRLTDCDTTHRRVFISREGAAWRRLLNEDKLWPMLEARGFERVSMEALSFTGQVKLMQETAILCAPHGAGLTNMIFCPRGTHVVELADLSFPNPNFYALAGAMELPYWLVSSEGVGDQHPSRQDLRTEPDALVQVIDQAIAALDAA